MASNTSARLTKTYTDEERRAVLHAHLIDGLSIAEVDRRARAGTLRPDLGAFGRHRFAYPIVKQGRERFEAENATALDSGVAAEQKRLVSLALARSRELDRDSDPAEIARRAKALAETHRALRSGPKTERPRASDREPVQTSEYTAQSQTDVLGQLSRLVNTAAPVQTEASRPVQTAGRG